MFYQTSMGLIYLIFNQLPFLWDTSDNLYKVITKIVPFLPKSEENFTCLEKDFL